MPYVGGLYRALVYMLHVHTGSMYIVGGSYACVLHCVILLQIV